jgi:hypothetical protein
MWVTGRVVRLALAVLVLLAPFGRAAEPGLVFSVRTWEREYASKDVPGGVESTPTVGAIYTVNADGTGLTGVVPPGAGVDIPAASWDGKWVYYQAGTRGGTKDGVPNVSVIDVDGGNRRQVTARKAPCGRVKWSPDGKLLSFVSFEGRYPQLFVVAAECGEPRQLTKLDGGVNFAHWRSE